MIHARSSGMLSGLLLFLMLALALVPSAMALPRGGCGGEDPNWKACEQDSDCVIGESACSAYEAYHRAALPEVNARNQCLRPMIKCAEPRNPDRSTIEPACVESRCQIRKK